MRAAMCSPGDLSDEAALPAHCAISAKSLVGVSIVCKVQAARITIRFCHVMLTYCVRAIVKVPPTHCSPRDRQLSAQNA